MTIPRGADARVQLARVEAQRDRQRARIRHLITTLPKSDVVDELRHHWRIESQLDVLVRDLRRDGDEAA